MDPSRSRFVPESSHDPGIRVWPTILPVRIRLVIRVEHIFPNETHEETTDSGVAEFVHVDRPSPPPETHG